MEGQVPVPPQALGLTLDAVPDSVGRARRAVADFARACDGDPERVALATSEAVTNVVLHAYDEGITGPLRVSAKLVSTDLLVTVSDDGRGLRPDLDSPGMGMGLALIGSLTSMTSFKTNGCGLDLTMEFPCPGED
jgi:serine/threonine-protein kinase RsbW